MSTKKTAEERAAEKYPNSIKYGIFDSVSNIQFRKVYATCIREEVEPKEAEIERLRALVQVLGDAFVLADNGRVQTDGTKQAVGHAHDIHAVWDMDNRRELAGKPCQKCLAFDAARIALKEAGFVPTNTTEA